MSWFFISPAAIHDDHVHLDREDSHHLLRVLRARPGELFTAVCGGQAYRAELIAPAGGQAVGRMVSVSPLAVEPPVAVSVFQGLAKGEKMEWVLQKGTELGAAVFVPVAARRSVVQLSGDKAVSRVQRWQQIAREAAQQSRRGVVPVVEPVHTWPAAAARAAAFDLALVLYEGLAGAGAGDQGESGHNHAPGLREVLQACPQPATVAVYIGPEGGLEADEVAAAVAAGARAIRFGPRILRTETAAPALLSALLYAVGDLG